LLICPFLLLLVVPVLFLLFQTSPQYEVFFLDFGNVDRVSASAVRPMPPILASVSPQAHPATLAYIQAPGLDADYGVEAAQRLSELIGNGRTLRAVVEGKERALSAAPKGWNSSAASASATPASKLLLTVLLCDAPASTAPVAHESNKAADESTKENGSDGIKEEYSESVNCIMVAEGLARVVEPRGKGRPAPTGEPGALLDALRNAQQEARQSHLGLWVYGDPGSDSEDDGGFPSLGGKNGKR